MTGHDDLVQLVPEWRQGTLDPDTASRVEAHVATCAECRATSDAYLVIQDLLADHDAPSSGDHPSSRQLVTLALGHESDDDRSRVETHVTSCPECASLVETVRDAEGTLERPAASVPPGVALPTGTTTRPSLPWWALVAAGVWVGLLAHPVYRSVTGPAGPPAGAAVEWSGAVDLPLLRPTHRGIGDGAPAIPLRDLPVVALAIDPGLPPDAEEDAPVEVSIDDASGATRWQLSMTAGEARDRSRRSGVLVLLVPTTALSPGPHVLRLKGPGSFAAEFGFEAVRE